MAQISPVFIKGEKKILFATVTDSTGTMTVTSPTFSLYNPDGTVVLDNVACSGMDASPAASIRVWYLLDTTNLAAGAYYGLIKIPSAASDGLPRVEGIDALIFIRPFPPL